MEHHENKYYDTDPIGTTSTINFPSQEGLIGGTRSYLMNSLKEKNSHITFKKLNENNLEVPQHILLLPRESFSKDSSFETIGGFFERRKEFALQSLRELGGMGLRAAGITLELDDRNPLTRRLSFDELMKIGGQPTPIYDDVLDNCATPIYDSVVAEFGLPANAT